MKKIIALLTIFILSFSSGYATISESTNIENLDLLKTDIFYINGEGYIKEDGKLKKVEGVKFYSIAGQQYAKKDGKLIKMQNNKIKKINGVNYIIVNDRLMTLDKYLALNPIKTENKTSNITFEEKRKIPTNLSLLSERKIKIIKNKTLEEALNLLEQTNPETKKWISKKSNQTKENFEKLKEIYQNKGETKLAKKFEVLANIENLDIQKINKAITAKLNNTEVKYSVDTKDNTSDQYQNITDMEDYNEYQDTTDTEDYNNYEDYGYNEPTDTDKETENIEDTIDDEELENDEDLEEIMNIFGDL